MKNLKTLGIAGALITAALVGGTLISVVAAAPAGTSPGNGAAADAADKAKYCDIWQKAFADKLNVTVDEAKAAAKAATIATIDAAVAAGDLTAERATEMKAKLADADLDGCRLLGHPFHVPGPGPGARVKFGTDLLSAAATALGIQPSDLITALRSGDTLQEITTDKGKSYATVSKAIHDAAKADLDKAVAAGMEQARADEILSDLDAALASGDFPGHGPGRGGHFGFPGARPPKPDDAPAAAT